ncbi:cytochrome c oxidase assembly protein COX18, mitochondrial isoform X2 [Lampris incognitus]|uniref:cytochrome c oxidase assembly protein COX18, mitochondrial isoform X2 n=1 Tax=Lampris incognitus TaxID=2546036 RepID=UPI0024B5173B|nr:cytochrome c oxidase assembly protein COX18, mitochondrial isoform X2 [Lampris incognitus]
MLHLRATVPRRPGSLKTLHQFLSLKPLTRTMSNASISCNHKPHQSHLCPVFTPHGLYSGSPHTVNVRPPCRRASSSSVDGTGLYGSLSDSTPIHLTEQLLVSVQQTTGLPWWASIMCTTLALRTLITLPLGAYQMVIIAKVGALQTEIAELAKRLRYEVSVRAKERGWTEQQCRHQFKKNLRRIVSELYIRDNCHPFKASLLVWVQLPMWVCLSLALRNLSLARSQSGAALQSELTAGGALWFSDLTLPDSTWILPVTLGLTNLFITESIALYWMTSSLVGLGHNLLLRSPRFQRLCHIPPLPSHSNTPYRDLLASFQAKFFK